MGTADRLKIEERGVEVKGGGRLVYRNMYLVVVHRYVYLRGLAVTWIERYIYGMRYLSLLLLSACQLTEPSGQLMSPSPATVQAEALADSCATAHGLSPKYPALTYYLVPGLSFTVGNLEVVGYGRDGKVWLADAYQDAIPLITHEILHARWGLPGGLDGKPHPQVFADCGLWPL